MLDITVNCVVEFTEAVFEGRYPKATYSHDRTLKVKVLKDSYGSKRA